MVAKVSFSLEGLNIIVTGALGILGKPLCEGLASFGANLILVDLNMMPLSALAEDLTSKYKNENIAINCNISNIDDIYLMMDKIERKGIKINVLFNHAATKGKELKNFLKPFESYSHENWKEITDVNLDGMTFMAQVVGNHFIKHKISGNIIQTASIYGVVAPDQRIYENSFYMDNPISSPAVYTVTKTAVIGLTRYLASYWGKYGIRVNSISPGGIESGQNSDFIDNYSNRVPLGRMGKPEDFVGAAIYLASPASSYITGQNLVVDGGLSVW